MVRLSLMMIGSLLSLSAWAAEFKTSIDRSQSQLNEPVLFTLSLINSDTRLRAEGVDPNVDLSRLSKDFNLGRPEASNSYNIYLGQGRSTSEIKVELFPKHSGKLTIPSFEVDGLKSARITLEVLPGSTTEEIFVSSGANLSSAWVGQQIVAYIDLYHRVELKTASLGSNLETEPVQIELLSNWKMPQEKRHEQLHGLDYEVERIAWAIFPSQAGPFTVQLPDIWVTTMTGKQLRLPQQQITLEVKPLPAGLPADIIIGKPTLTAGPLPADFKQYEMSQWTLTLMAPVGVTALPKLLPGIALPEGLKLYPDPARYRTRQSSAGIMDVADYTLSIMPLTAGEFALPSIRIPYFDPASGQAALLELPGTKISVAAGDIPVPAAIITDKARIVTTATEIDMPSIKMWQASTALLALLWLATLFVLWRKQSAPAADIGNTQAEPAKSKDTRHPLQQQLLTAMHSRTLEEGLQQWLQQHPEDRIVLDAVRSVQRFCYGHSKQPEAEIQSRVREAVALIKRMPVRNDSGKTDPWRAESSFLRK